MNKKEVTRLAARIVKQSKTMTPEAHQLAIEDAIYQGIAETYDLAAQVMQMCASKGGELASWARTFRRAADDPRRDRVGDGPPQDATSGDAS